VYSLESMVLSVLEVGWASSPWQQGPCWRNYKHLIQCLSMYCAILRTRISIHRVQIARSWMGISISVCV